MSNILGYTALKQLVREGMITEVNYSQIQPASIDLTLNGMWYDTISKKQFEAERITLHPYNPQYEAWWALCNRFRLPIEHRPSLIIGETQQKFFIPYDVAGDIKLKSTPSRAGLDVSMGGWVDPGYVGTLSIVIRTYRKVVLRKFEPFCQIVLHRLAEPTIPYTGKYQGSQGPIPAKEYDYR